MRSKHVFEILSSYFRCSQSARYRKELPPSFSLLPSYILINQQSQALTETAVPTTRGGGSSSLHLFPVPFMPSASGVNHPGSKTGAESAKTTLKLKN